MGPLSRYDVQSSCSLCQTWVQTKQLLGHMKLGLVRYARKLGVLPACFPVSQAAVAVIKSGTADSPTFQASGILVQSVKCGLGEPLRPSRTSMELRLSAVLQLAVSKDGGLWCLPWLLLLASTL